MRRAFDRPDLRGGFFRRRLLSGSLVLGVLYTAAAIAPAQPLPGPSAARTAAIYYDGPDAPLAEGYLDAHQIENLLGHFDYASSVIPIARYEPGQLDRYDAAFFLGTISGTSFPAGFLSDVRGYSKPFTWIGRHIGALVNDPAAARFGFTYADYRDDLEFRQVIYKGVALPKEDPDINIVSIPDPSAVEVLARAVNDEKVEHPYVVRRGRFWYFADIPFSYMQEGGHYLAFCDLLHDILEVDHAPQSLALARIEDVSADIDPANLRQIADVLGARKVPFQIAVIPIFRNPSRGFEVHLSDRPFLVAAIQYMIEHGGTPVMHGVTHQYQGQSGDDFEFWDEMGNRPVPGDSVEVVQRRLETGLAECFANGIYPIAFETPHYASSETAYEAMKPVFTLFNERTMTMPEISTIQFFPYPVRDRFGRGVVPENLGYLPQDDPDPKVILARARNMKVVRDAIASFYFHPFLDVNLLAETADGIANLGYEFVPLRKFGGEVNFRDRYEVRTASGKARIAPNNEYWRLRRYDAGGKLIEERRSDTRMSGPVEVDVELPPGGWAALDCPQDAPRAAPPSGWKATLASWWSGVNPSTRPLGGVEGFYASRDAWVLEADGAGAGEENNQRSYVAALDVFGYRTRGIKLGEFGAAPGDASTVLAVPAAAGARLTDSQRKLILDYLESGGLLLADGGQPWLEQLGFQWSGRRIPVSKVTDVLFPEMTLRWQPEEAIERFTAPEGSQPLMIDTASQQPVAVGGRHGEGSYIYLAAPLDEHTPDGTSHYPYLAEYMNEVFRYRPTLRSSRLEVYFDPGFRQGVNPDRLASSWRQSGIRTVYVAAWQYYSTYAYDYASFVRACHRNGISVYAWFIFPAVTPLLWEQHPEWRERTAAGTDGRVGWRYLMNFEDPDCFRAAMEWMQQVLAGHPWDGVNISELNYDADFDDYLRPDRFVPMNRQVRAAFEQKQGFDPAELFDAASKRYYKRDRAALDQFLSYREDLVTSWHRRVLTELERVRQGREWEIIVTMLDSLHSDYVRPALGVDSRRIVSLMKDFDFTLQVEDPAEFWMKPPERYRRFAETYLKLVPDKRRLMFDVNVLPDRDVEGTTLPSALATGSELALTVAAAASASGRAAIYSEHTVPTQDWGLIDEALARSSRLEQQGAEWKVAGAQPMMLDSPEAHGYYVDGGVWPVDARAGLMIPPGEHRLSINRPWYRWRNWGEPGARLLHLSADLLDAQARPTGLSLRYASPGRAVVLLSQKPIDIFVDGRREKLVVEGAGDRWAVFAPRGEHELSVEMATSAGLAVNAWGWLSAVLITLFGAITTLLMIGIYSRLRLARAVRRGSAS